MDIHTILTRFGRTVREHRKAQGTTLPDLAGVAGISKGHLSQIEHGKRNVSLETIHKLADALRIDVRVLVR